MPRLTSAQQRFMDACERAGDEGHPSPHSAGRESAARISAWHRTARSLQRRGLVRVAHNGSTARAWASHACPLGED